MKYRIGIFDPAFRPEGHFVAFNRYMSEIFNTPDIEVTFIDEAGKMRAAYGSHGTYLDLPARPSVKQFLPSRIARAYSRLSFWRNAFRVIDEAGFDLVLFTADPRDILMCVVPIRFAYGVVILYPYAYVGKSKTSISDRIRSYLYRKFVACASKRISTNEPPILAAIATQLNMSDIQWIPDMPVKEVPSDESTLKQVEFLTIGTISSTKNHLFALDAFESNSLPYTYLIAGKIIDSTGERVETRIKELSENSALSIRSQLGYLDEDAYRYLMENAKFLIFPYDFTRGNISSQVLHDAFSTRTPFVAPDIEPFKWYVERYHIGILYIEGDNTSFGSAIREIHSSDPKSFVTGFDRLATDHSLAAIRARLVPSIIPTR